MKLLKTALLVGVAFGTVGTAMASKGGAGMIGGRHDYATRAQYLGTVTDSGRAGVKNTAGMCSYCHTPHSAISTALLWNKKAGKTSYTWDITATSNGTAMSTLTTGPSMKCLACHDGSVAIGDVKLYRSGLNVTANTFVVGQSKAAYTSSTNTFTGEGAKAQFVIGSGGTLSGTHPVGVAYPFGQAINTYNGTTTGVNVPVLEFAANPHQVSTSTRGGGKTASDKYPDANGLGNQDSYIKLYSNQAGAIVAGTAAGKTGMECSTCHDPHNKQTADDWMLRGTASGSGDSTSKGYICIQCHLK